MSLRKLARWANFLKLIPEDLPRKSTGTRDRRI